MNDMTMNPKTLIDRYKRIQNVCDNLLARMEECFDQNLIIEDPKELVRLEHLLKLRSKLLDFDREIRAEYNNIMINPHQEEHQTREFLILEIINKINQATPI